jgi:competence protein ComEA
VDASAISGHFHLFSFILGLLSALILVGGTLFLTRRPDPPPIVLHPPPTPAPTETPSPTATPAPITVFVSGAVHKPGLYTLAPSARVGDALAQAGGLTEDANPVAVNQAEPLWDGAQVHVPAVVELEVAEGSALASRGLAIEPPAGVSGAANGSQQGETSSGAPGGSIDINSANAEELATLPGIGPSKAAAIIENRPYASVDDLERVPGIGAKTIERLRDLIVAQ